MACLPAATTGLGDTRYTPKSSSVHIQKIWTTPRVRPNLLLLKPLHSRGLAVQDKEQFPACEIIFNQPSKLISQKP